MKGILTNPVGRVFPIHVDREDMFFKWEIEEYIARERDYLISQASMSIKELQTRRDMIDRMEEYFLPED